MMRCETIPGAPTQELREEEDDEVALAEASLAVALAMGARRLAAGARELDLKGDDSGVREAVAREILAVDATLANRRRVLTAAAAGVRPNCTGGGDGGGCDCGDGGRVCGGG